MALFRAAKKHIQIMDVEHFSDDDVHVPNDNVSSGDDEENSCNALERDEEEEQAFHDRNKEEANMIEPRQRLPILQRGLFDSDSSDGEKDETEVDEGGEGDDEEVQEARSDDEDNMDGEVSDVNDDDSDNEAEGRPSFLDDFVPTTFENGRSGFRCKKCPKVKLQNERDVVNHLQSKV
jgi:hypothetical protein